MSTRSFERIFPGDVLSKRERIERALNHQALDRAPLHEQLSFNPGVIALYTGRQIEGFDYTLADIGAVIRQTVDACFPPFAPKGTERVTDADGFVIQHDNWTSWTVSRPFADVRGARDYLLGKTEQLLSAPFDAGQERVRYRDYMRDLQSLVGETVIIDYPVGTGFCDCWSKLGLELFVYLYDADPQVVSGYIEARTAAAVRQIHAIADPGLSPVVLIAEDFATKKGPIFSPALLERAHFGGVKRLTEAWQSHGLKVLYHSDGNWKMVIRQLTQCGVDGFYCLEPAVGMDIVELRRAWPHHLWAGGIDGVDLLERGAPEQVRAEVQRVIRETDVLHRGGIFIDSSSEINPPVRPENFRAMVEAVGEMTNPRFSVADAGNPERSGR